MTDVKPLNRELTTEEKLALGSRMEDFHKLFYVFWEMGSVSFTDSIGTAAIRFSERAKPIMMINSVFWDHLNEVTKLFVVSHECMHVMLDHGVRNGMHLKGATPELVNVAQDITINEMLVSIFGFTREELTDWQKACWIDTCFKNHQLIARNEAFTYYLQKLIEQQNSSNPMPSLPKTLDEHGAPGEGSGKPGEGLMCEGPLTEALRARLSKDLADSLDPGALEELIEKLKSNSKLPGGKLAGTMAGMLQELFEKQLVKPKWKFRRLLRQLKKTRTLPKEVDFDSFTREPNRLPAIDRLALPGSFEAEKTSKDKLWIRLFFDVSGSCMTWIPKFWRIAQMFSADPIFDVECFKFDTSISPIEPGDRVSVGGGTDFKIIEDYVTNGKAKYPDCVLVLTDGFGTVVNPKIPERWVWLLTPTESYYKPSDQTRYVHSQSKAHWLEDVDFD